MNSPKRETEIQREILEFLQENRIFFWRQQNHSPRGRKLVGLGTRRGAPDIMGIYKGVFFGLEVKVPGKPLSSHQIEFIEDIRKAGGIAGRVESVLQTCQVLGIPTNSNC